MPIQHTRLFLAQANWINKLQKVIIDEKLWLVVNKRRSLCVRNTRHCNWEKYACRYIHVSERAILLSLPIDFFVNNQQHSTLNWLERHLSKTLKERNSLMHWLCQIYIYVNIVNIVLFTKTSNVMNVMNTLSLADCI